MLLQQTHSRPRNLPWYLAGPMLFGDLGTSRFYVLGLAFFYSGMAAPYYVAAIGLLIIAVGWAYSVICRANPDGGGVYSSGRMIHPTLGVIGATLLFTDYVVTAALSAYEGIVYIGGDSPHVHQVAPIAAILALVALGGLNSIGPRRAGTFALVVAIAAIALTLVLALGTMRHLPEGWAAMTPPRSGTAHRWNNFVHIVLALSGIEAVANLTGIMSYPLKRTIKLSIWPVVAEVVVLNVLLVIVVCSIPGLADHGVLAEKASLTPGELDLRDRILWVLASVHLGRGFAIFSGIIFGVLLLSAANTAMVGMMNIQYAMSRDRELPAWFSRINSFGVPWGGLVAACALPAVIVLVTGGDAGTMADMYAIGVVGAITINLGASAVNRKLEIFKLERGGLLAIGAFMLVVWITIALTKHWATLFLAIMLGGALGLRFVAHRLVLKPPFVPVPEPAPAAVAAQALPPLLPFDPGKRRVLVSTRGNLNLVKFGAAQAKQLDANLFVLFVRELAVLFPGDQPPLTAEEDQEAATVFQTAQQVAREYGIPLQMIYSVSPQPADVILDFAATYAADQVVLGISRRAAVLRALRGDVISTVAANLPAESTLLIHA